MNYKLKKLKENTYEIKYDDIIQCKVLCHLCKNEATLTIEYVVMDVDNLPLYIMKPICDKCLKNYND